MCKNIYDGKTFINDLLRQQSNLMIDFNTLIVLVLGINFLTCGIEKILNKELFKPGLLYLMIGILFVIIYIVIYLRHKLDYYKYDIYIKGIVFKSNKRVVSIKNYKSSEDMVYFFECASVESRDIKGIIELKDFDIWKKSFERLIKDLVEYLLLYYMELANSEITNHSIKLIEVDRNMLTEFVVNNKIFSLFTEDTEKRAMFGNEKVEKTVVSAMSSGALYEKLVIRLPEKCTLKRINDGIELENDMFHLKICYIFNERVCGKVLPKCFIEKYAKCNDEIIDNSSLGLNIIFKPKLSSLFFKTLELYSWVDKYVNYIFNAFSFDDFLKKINWNMLEAEEYMKEKD